MYIPPAFQVTDVKTLHDFMQQNSFATVVSNGENGPAASHLPLQLDRSVGHLGTLIGHMARANPHWKTAEDQKVLAVFNGPHAYVSPTWYAEANVVPTWNYVKVHATGILRIEHNAQRLRQIVEDAVAEYESGLLQPWSMNTVDNQFSKPLLNGIVGFTIEIQELKGKWKLSQNHSVERRTGVIAGLRQRDDGHDRQIADLMDQQMPADRG